ncbi:SMP-30/gluconolactonase/LRE family protein [Corallincola luteus]|uniref:SMP-30/gluconolactonase/LRE family protein n=1 Tax=Corallincola luteus TaxID=1775177 RepID=A0ABY2AL55_9GAMM|nr:SMP-30/gluconolactonase/LRE family protein [Corallincola luteus]TCI03653.1 SMP-30/gluconolactonase/LRE family protein [Corallincola luteus]
MSEVITALANCAQLAECPRWDPEQQRLFWVDIDAGRLHAFDPKTGQDSYLQLDEEIGCFAVREKGGFVAGLRSGFVTIDSLAGGITPIADPEQDKPHQRFNDGRCDPAGRFLAGTLNPNKDAYSGHYYTLDLDLSVRKLVGNNWTSNGLAFSPDGKTLYYSDTPRHVVFACDYDVVTGAVSNQREFIRFPHGFGRPDGAAVDSEGYYWSALYGGGRVVRISPAGKVVNTITVPAKNPTMVAFGGESMNTLFITTADTDYAPEKAQYPLSGSLFSVNLPVTGLIEPKFKG